MHTDGRSHYFSVFSLPNLFIYAHFVEGFKTFFLTFFKVKSKRPKMPKKTYSVSFADHWFSDVLFNKCHKNHKILATNVLKCHKIVLKIVIKS